jgi:hypothetical protein
MAAINLSVEHGRDFDDAKGRLRTAVEQTTGRFAALVRRTDWAADGQSVRVAGVGFTVDMRVDATHAT